MNETGYSVLKLSKFDGAYVYAKQAREFAIGATGAGGYLNAKAVASGWNDVEFINTLGIGTTIPTTIGIGSTTLITGGVTTIGGTTPIGDLRAEATGYMGIGATSPYIFERGVNYSGALMAIYKGTTWETGKVGIGTTAGDLTTSGYYEGNFTTNNIHEFQTSFTADSTDLSKITTGSGVYTEGADVTLQFNILNRNGEQLSSAAQIAADPFVSGQKISILNTDGTVVFSDYRIGGDSTFTFSRSQNIDVFGSFTRNFGIRNEVVNQDGGIHTSEFYLYANTATFNKVFVRSSGQTVLNENYSNLNPPDTGSITDAADREDAIKYFNNQPINNSGVTGFIEFNLGFNESPSFTSLGDVVLFYGTSGELETNRGTLVGNYPLDSIQEGQRIRLTANDGIPEGTGLFFKLAADTEVGFNEELFNVGPFTLEPEVEGPDLNLYNQGDQLLVGDFTIEGGLGGDDADGGNLNVSGNALGTGIGGRLTGPDSRMYLLSGDAAGTESDTLQTVTDRGNTTTQSVGIGTTSISTSKLEVVGNSVEVRIATSDGYSIRSAQKADIGIGGTISSSGSMLAGGSGNHISGDYDTIAGGTINNISGGNFNFIGGGSQIDITGSEYSSSIGGKNNDILYSDYSVIGGGRDNKIENSTVGFIGGGESNQVNDDVSAIAGGISNKISGGNGYSFIGGGEENEIHGTFSSILGGEGNKLYSNDAVTLGGWFTESSGQFSLVGPGKASKVSGDYAVALGNKIEIPVAHTGATVLADGQNRVHASSGMHTATLDFASGVYVSTIGYFGEGLHVSGVPVLTGENNPAEADTLQTVTDRGATTTNDITVADLLVQNDGQVRANGAGGLTLGNTNGGTIFVSGTSAKSIITPRVNDLYLQSNRNEDDIIFQAGEADVEMARFDSANQRFGIGTVSPSAMLHVEGSAQIKGAAGWAGVDTQGGAIYMSDVGVGLLGNMGSNYARPLISTSSQTIIFGSDGTSAIRNIKYNAGNGAGAADSEHNFYTSGSNVRLHIAKDGKVGIGTDSPDTKLHVKGTAIRFEEAGSSTRHFDIIPAVAGANHKFTSDSTVAGYEFYNNVNSLVNFTNTEANFNPSGENIDFRVKSSGSTAIFVDASIGTVGINQTSPSSTYALDVGGSIRMATAAPSLVLRETDSSNQEFSVFGLGGDFYVRDITQSTYPFKIEAGVANDTLVLASGGNVGIGTDTASTIGGTAGLTVQKASVAMAWGPSVGEIVYHRRLSAGKFQIVPYYGGNIGELQLAPYGENDTPVVIGGTAAVAGVKLHVEGVVSGSNSFLGTGVGNRITNNHVPYLLSGDEAGATNTLQDVCDNGNITTTSIKAAAITGIGDLSIVKTDPKIILYDNAGANTDPNGEIVFKETAGSENFAIRYNGANDRLEFNSPNDSTTGILTITRGFGSVSNQKVGVNTLAPTTNFHVVGTGNTQGGVITVQNSNTSDGSYCGIQFINSTVNTPRSAIFAMRTGGAYDADLTFHTTTANELNSTDYPTATERMRITHDGTVGIGTNAPTEKLEINPDTDVSAIIGKAHVGYMGTSNHARFSHVDFANSSQWAFSQTNGGSTQINTKSAGEITFHVNTIQKAKINSDGDFQVDTDTLYVDASADRVGIGTTAPNSTLHVEGVVSGSGSFLGTGVGNRITNNGVPYLLSGDSPAETQTLQDVCDNGNTTTTAVGIGTTNPTTKLEVSGAVSDSLAAFRDGSDGVEITTRGASRQQIDFLGSNTSAINAKGSLHINYDSDNGGSNDSIQFTRNGIDEAGTLDMIIKEGNVGIGTSAPQKNLDIQGQFMVRPTANTTIGRVLIGSTASDAYLELKDASSNNQVFLNTDGDSYFNGGDVGIGTTSPDYKLDVVGTARITGGNVRIQTNDPQLIFHDNAGSTYDASWMYQNNAISFVWGGGLKFKVDSAGGVTLGQSYSSSVTAPSKGIITEGRVGLGTTSPSATLHVADTTNETDGKVIISGTGTSTNAADVYIYGSGNSDVINAVRDRNDASIKVTSTTAGAYFRTNSATTFYNGLDLNSNWFIGQYAYGSSNQDLRIVEGTASAGDSAAAVTIQDSTKYVGIGTTNPQELLHIDGSSPRIRLRDSDAAGTPYAHIDASDGALLIEADKGDETASSYISLTVDGSESIRTIAGGNVGIGTTSPSYELDVNGTTRSTYYIGGAYFEENASSSKIKFYPNGTVLVMDEDGELKPCEKEKDTLVFGVSKRNFEQPIVLGAEPILITGPIKVGDYIVTSSKQGHGQAMKEQKLGTIIAQAMENGDGESYNIKAMIRKM